MAIDVDVEDREKDADSQHPAQFRLVNLLDMGHGAVGGTHDCVFIGGNRSFRIAEEPRDLEPEHEQRHGQESQPWVNEDRQQRRPGESEEKKAGEEEHFRQAVPRKAKSIPPCEPVVHGAKGIAANIAGELQITCIDDVVRTVGAGSLPFLGHVADITGADGSQPGAATASPGKLEADDKTAARLNGHRKLRRRGQIVGHAWYHMRLQRTVRVLTIFPFVGLDYVRYTEKGRSPPRLSNPKPFHSSGVKS